MKPLFWMSIIFCIGLAMPIHANENPISNEEPIYGPADEWVERLDIQKILDENPKSNNFFILADRQIKIENGETKAYSDIALRASSKEFLNVISGIMKPKWQPDRGNLTIHRLNIVRNNQVIDLIEKGVRFEILRRETRLEQQALNGILTATTQIEDMQIGDIVRVSFTKSSQNPSLGGRAEIISNFVDNSINSDFGRLRLVWPVNSEMNYKVFNHKAVPKVTEKNGYKILDFDLFSKKGKDIPDDAPSRFKIKKSLWATDFQNWQEVSKVAYQQYKTEGTIAAASPLASEVAKIRQAAPTSMERAAMAIRLVQDKVRYLYSGLGYGNYEPQLPAETWKLRYGDCKAKTLLLLAILHELDIDAQPMLVSLSSRDATSVWLPSMAAFDHIMVQANIDGKTLWLDGTGAGTRIEDLQDTPLVQYGLPLTLGGEELLHIPFRPAGRPYQDVALSYDMSAGLALPAIFDINVKLRDSDAGELKTLKEQSTTKEFNKKVDEVVGQYVLSATVAESNVTYDEDRDEVTLMASGISYSDWETVDGLQTNSIGTTVSWMEFDADRTKPETREIPVAIKNPEYYREKAIYILPSSKKGYMLKGQQQRNETIAGRQIIQNANLNGSRLIFQEEKFLKTPEILASDIKLEKRKLKRAQRGGLKIVADSSHPKNWQEIKKANANASLSRHETILNKIVSRNKDETTPYTYRASFYDLIGDYKLAAKDRQKIEEIEPTADNIVNRADITMNFDKKLAEELYRKAIKIDPSHADAVYELVRKLIVDRKFDAASEIVEATYAKGLDDNEAELLKARIDIGRGNIKKGQERIDLLLEEYPDDTYILYMNCRLKGLGNFDLENGLKACSKNINLSDDPEYSLGARGLIYLRMGKYAEALDDFNQAIEKSPLWASSYYKRAIANKRLGNKQASKNDLEAATFFKKHVADEFEFFGITLN